MQTLPKNVQSSVWQLMYLRAYEPALFAKVSATLEKKGLSGIDDLFSHSQDMAGWGKFRKKLVKVVQLSNPLTLALKAVVPKNIQNKASDWEKKHRTAIKAIGAIAAIAVAAPFMGTMISNVGSMIGNLSAKEIGLAAIKKIGTTAAVQAIAKAGGKGSEAAQMVVQVAQGQPVTGDQAATAVADDMAAMVQKIGTQKVNEIAAKYTNNGQAPITNASDPRFTQMQADLAQAYSAANGEPITTPAAQEMVKTEIQQNTQKAESGFAKYLPYAAGGLLALKLLAI